MIRLLRIIATIFLGSVFALAQESTGAVAPRVRSHVDRFTTLDARAERVEIETSAKLRTNPNDTEALNLRAAARILSGRYSEAHDDLRRAVALKPDDANYQANLGYVLWKLGRIDEAFGAMRVSLKIDDRNFTAHYQLGRFLLRTNGPGQAAEAAAHLRRALEIDPLKLEVRFELIAAYRALGDRAQASTQLDFLSDARPTDPRVFYTSALLATDREDLEAAIRDFREALRRDPSLFEAWQDLGFVYIKLKRWPEAVETFGELARRQPASVDAGYLYALSLFNNGRPADAEREVRRALRINAGAAEAHTLLGVILASRGDANNEASDALSQAAALKPTSFDAHFYLGRALYALKDFAGASRSLREAVKLNPRSAEARFFLGTVLEAAGESEAAMVEYQDLVRLDDASAIGQIGRGALLVKQGKTDEAITALTRAIELDSTSFEAHWALGRAYTVAGRYAEAIEPLKKAVSIRPERADSHYQLGLALKRLGRDDEAAREFALVEKINREFRTSTTQKN
jgi:tetratricopeptide (TPR) repeat protein